MLGSHFMRQCTQTCLLIVLCFRYIMVRLGLELIRCGMCILWNTVVPRGFTNTGHSHLALVAHRNLCIDTGSVLMLE